MLNKISKKKRSKYRHQTSNCTSKICKLKWVKAPHNNQRKPLTIFKTDLSNLSSNSTQRLLLVTLCSKLKSLQIKKLYKFEVKMDRYFRFLRQNWIEFNQWWTKMDSNHSQSHKWLMAVKSNTYNKKPKNSSSYKTLMVSNGSVLSLQTPDLVSDMFRLPIGFKWWWTRVKCLSFNKWIRKVKWMSNNKNSWLNSFKVDSIKS